MTKKIAYGIDLGTSRSGIARASGDSLPFAVEALPVGDPHGASDGVRYRMPSVSARCSGWLLQNKVTGEKAVEMIGKERWSIVQSAKSELGDGKIYFDGPKTGIRTPSEAIAVILKEVLRRASAIDGGAITESISIAVPASMPDDARREILWAGEKSGIVLTEGDLIEEPVAVLLDALHSDDAAQWAEKEKLNIAVYDFGAGTCDTAVFEATRRAIDVGDNEPNFSIRTIAVGDYDRLGGDNLDLCIASDSLLPQILDHPAAEAEALFAFSNVLVARMLKETLSEKLAKEMIRLGLDPLTTPPRKYPHVEVHATTFAVSGPDIDIPAQSVTLSTETMLAAILPFLSLDPFAGETRDGLWYGSILEPLAAALGKAGMKAAALDLVIIAGGSAQMPCVRYVLAEWARTENLAPDLLFFADPDLAVERGAAIAALYRLITNRPLVTPILSDDFGIVTHGEGSEILAKAGTCLPYPATGQMELLETFFVPEKSLDCVVVRLFAGHGTRHRILFSQSFDLPPDTPVGARVRVSYRIDASKIIHLSATLASNQKSSLVMSGEDVWIKGREKQDMENLKRARKIVKDAIMQVGVPPIESALTWAGAEIERKTDAGNRQAREILHYVIKNQAGNARAWNFFGLLRWNENDLPGAEVCFRKAIIHKSDATHQGNLGHALLQMSRLDDAEIVIGPLHAANPSDARAAELFARIRFAKGKYEEAKEIRNKTIGLLERKIRSQSLDSYSAGWVAAMLEALGQAPEARRIRDEYRDKPKGHESKDAPCRYALLGSSGSKAKPVKRFKIGAAELCEPDYQQILAWACQLKWLPDQVLDRVVAGKKDAKSEIVDGRFIHLVIWLSKLPLTRLDWEPGLEVKSLCFEGAPSGSIELKFSYTPSLTSIYCNRYMQLTKMDLSNLPNLLKLDCYENELTDLDLSCAPSLREVQCGNNKIKDINLSNSPNIVSLRCCKNAIANLDLSHTPNLAELFCKENPLVSLDLSCAKNLTNCDWPDWKANRGPISRYELTDVEKKWIAAFDDHTATELCVRFAIALNRNDISILEPILAPDVSFHSSEPLLEGARAVLNRFRAKALRNRLDGEAGKIFSRLGQVADGKPAVVLCHRDSAIGRSGLGRPQGLFEIFTAEGQISKIVRTLNWQVCKQTDLIPGLDEAELTAARSFEGKTV